MQSVPFSQRASNIFIKFFANLQQIYYNFLKFLGKLKAHHAKRSRIGEYLGVHFDHIFKTIF